MEPNTQKRSFLPITIAVVVIVVGGGFLLWRYLYPPVSTPSENTSAFEPSVTLGADGQTATLVTAVGKGAEAFDITLVPTEVREDSRCPVDVTCIQAGTVRLLVTITDSFGEHQEIVTL